MRPGKLRMQNKACKGSHAVPQFSELLGIVHRKQGHIQQEDDIVKLCKHTCFSLKTSPLLLRLMQFCWKHWCRDLPGFLATLRKKIKEQGLWWPQSTKKMTHFVQNLPTQDLKQAVPGTTDHSCFLITITHTIIICGVRKKAIADAALYNQTAVHHTGKCMTPL